MVQSLLTQEEYDKLSKHFNTYNPSARRSKPPFRIVKVEGKEFECGPPPNYIMGNPLSTKEVKLINSRLEAVMKEAGITWSTTF